MKKYLDYLYEMKHKHTEEITKLNNDDAFPDDGYSDKVHAAKFSAALLAVEHADKSIDLFLKHCVVVSDG